MRLLFYHSPAVYTAVARAFAAAARGLAAQGHTVHFACPPEGAIEQRLDYGAYEILPLAEGPLPLEISRLKRALIDRFIECVIVAGERDHLVVASASRMAGRAAILRRIPGESRTSFSVRGRVAAQLTATGLLYATEEERRTAPPIKGLRLPSGVAPLGVDPESYQHVRAVPRATIDAAPSSSVIAVVYDPSGRALAATALRVLALLAPRHPELRLVFIGPGSDSEELRMHAAALRISRFVTFLGERDDALGVMRAADLGWVAGRGDGAGYACLDLLSLRLPVLAERSPVVQQYIADGITGLLFRGGEPQETAAAVARLLAHEEQRVAMGTAGAARVARDYTEQTMLAAYEEALARAADREHW
jgi:glycosyltransferase involved in cell wall biosynthesis